MIDTDSRAGRIFVFVIVISFVAAIAGPYFSFGGPVEIASAGTSTTGYNETWETNTLSGNDYTEIKNTTPTGPAIGSFVDRGDANQWAYEQDATYDGGVGEIIIESDDTFDFDSDSGDFTFKMEMRPQWGGCDDINSRGRVYFQNQDTNETVQMGFNTRDSSAGGWIARTPGLDDYKVEGSVDCSGSGDKGWTDMRLEYDNSTGGWDWYVGGSLAQEWTEQFNPEGSYKVIIRTKSWHDEGVTYRWDNINITAFDLLGPGVKGTVTNSTGSGIEDAQVTLRTEDEPGLITAETTTDSNGNFRVDDDELTTNTYTVFVNKWPYYYTNRTVVDHTTGTVTDAGTIELESRGPGITLADPRANEYIRDRSLNGFNYSYTIQQPISEDINDDFNTIVYWKNDSTGEFENIHEETNNVKSGTYTVDFQNPDAGNPGVNKWFVSVELRRGTFNSTTYQYNTPGNITLVDASTDATITDATIEAEITGVNSDFQTTLSTSDGKLDLNDIPREDHKVTFTTTSGTIYLDRTLIIDETDITKLWTVGLVNETEFDDEPEWYKQSFKLDDQTGQWDPADTYLFLEQRVSGTFQIITGGQFGFQNNVTLAVNDTESYRMTLLHAERGDTRQVGDFTADRDNAGLIQTITIDSTSPPVEDDSGGYTVNALITNTTGLEPIFRFQYNDSESDTFDISFTVHEKGNESNVLQNMTNVSFDSAGSITFTIPVTQEEATNTWHVDWSATRNGQSISGTLTVGGAALDPGVDMPDTWKHWGATIFIILIGGLFGGSVNARLGVIVTPMIAGVFWVAEWLPTNYTIGIIIFALILGGMLLVANHRLGD